jgi:hypothetical protein
MKVNSLTPECVAIFSMPPKWLTKGDFTLFGDSGGMTQRDAVQVDSRAIFLFV